MTAQGSLFAPNPDEIPPALDIAIVREAIPFDQASDAFQRLLAEVDWKQEHIKMFGKEIGIPRLTAWYGDPERSYTYSGIALTPLEWTPLLNELRAAVEKIAGHEFNSVLLNLYRDANDSVSWHADDEPDLGREPVIGSLSLGASRRFDFRKKTDHSERFKSVLNSGDLVVMRGTSQQLWDHQVPKEPKATGPRINLTFRQILGR
jgi:alkylated DNA repair dioxygenase AlkB